MPELEIIRREKITVSSTQENQYGDLIVKTKAGNELKIGKKRSQLFVVFQPGTEVTVGYATYMNKEYIAEATPSAQVVSANTPVVVEKPVMSKDDWAEKEAKTRKSIERQTSLNAAVELVKLAPTKATSDLVIEIAKKFENYLATGEVPISKVVAEAQKLGGKIIEEKGGNK